MLKYQIINRDGLNIGRPYASRLRARRKIDRLDNAHGSYCHYLKTVTVIKSRGGSS